MNVSVIVCTHNPRHSYLSRVLSALKEQTLPLAKWELLVIDNASMTTLSEYFDVRWHPQGRHIRENSLGLTSARLRGIAEAQADLLVFVDDDNILEPDYLEQAYYLSQTFPNLGAYGGQVKPEFEVPAPDWTRPYWPYLAIKEDIQDLWSNDPEHWRSQPCGAGLCVRRSVADSYVEALKCEPVRASLDRKGKELLACGDSDIVQTSLHLNLGFGVLTVLKLTHLISASRLQEKYLLRLVTGIFASAYVLHYINFNKPIPENHTLRSKLRYILKLLILTGPNRRKYLAEMRARSLAKRILSDAGIIPRK